MRTVRILDLRRGHLRAEFVPKLRVESFHRSDSEGCTIVIIDRPSPDRFSTGPLYMCALRARGLAPSRVFLLYRTDNRLPTPPITAPSWISAGVLANDMCLSYVLLIMRGCIPAGLPVPYRVAVHPLLRHLLKRQHI